ncbi:MAG: DUF167 domain-containing protein [Candidatus Saccharibacteria bacterium]|nr:DUF167 domain-containing protein [Candidatus Saccharibacteria bacterium]
MDIRLRVKAGTSQGDKLEQLPDGSYLAYLRAKPVDGQANVALVKLLSKHFKVAKSNVFIKNGATSHYKTIRIDN